MFAVALCNACATGSSPPEATHEGLRLVPDSKMQHAWVKPGEDFSQYDMIGVLDCYVAFKKSWRLNHPDLRAADMYKVRNWLTAELRAIISSELWRNGYQIATAAKKNVLLVRPALIDLEVLEPVTQSEENGIAFKASTGSAILYVELYDAESSEILARAVDREQINHIGDIEIASISAGSDDTRRLLNHWADLIVGELERT
ncbi:MAG: DUF3313 family protein, partial [Deltaproteobacteria bacterium]|nr:DUF3313 family protein [Deltaproteobacteria bacterium]